MKVLKLPWGLPRIKIKIRGSHGKLFAITPITFFPSFIASVTSHSACAQDKPWGH